MPKAVIIIPTYNERDNISQVVSLLDRVRTAVKSWEIEVLVVDDTSPDKTYQVVESLQEKRPHLHLLVNPKKSGLGGAYLKGMSHAFGPLGATAVFEFDADLSHDPQKIPEFLEKIDQGYDLVLGSRYIKGGSIPANWGLDRKFLSIVGNLFINVVLTNFTIRDWTTGYRALTKGVYQAVAPKLVGEEFTGYAFQVGFLHQALRQGFKIVEVPFHFIDRTSGTSKLGGEYIKNAFLFICRVRLMEILSNRIFKFALVGGVGALVQLTSLTLYRWLLPITPLTWLTPYQVATILSIETAIVSNFVLNNAWTFADRSLSLIQIPLKFAQFNLASLGSLLIQFILSSAGEWAIGLFVLFTLPLIGFEVDTGLLFALLGILVGMFWNFFAYTKLVWRTKKEPRPKAKTAPW